MRRIQKLPVGVVNKIAAGEVVERPASVVKELVENALDAGASRIDVAIEQGGNQLIRVADDGQGIAADDLPLAVASHATSKLASAEDLFQVRTLGFRGEALASIAEVSRFVIRSRTRDATSGVELEVNAGQVGAVAPVGCPCGTLVEVHNLFFNTPVRRKFLRSTPTEVGHVTDAFTRLALAFPGVHFTLRHNQRPIFDLPAAADWQERISRLFGEELAESLLWVESRDDDVRLSGYVGHPNHSRANPKMQYLFLNGRHIRDRSLQHALTEAYRGLLVTGRYPISCLAFEMPPELVDVNVHPTKLEVRFQDGGRLYSQLLGTLRTRFLTTDLTHRLAPAKPVNESQRSALEQDLVGWAKSQVSMWTGAPAQSAPGSGSDETLPSAGLDTSGRLAAPRPVPLSVFDLAPRQDAVTRSSPGPQSGGGYRAAPESQLGSSGPLQSADEQPAETPAAGPWNSAGPREAAQPAERSDAGSHAGDSHEYGPPTGSHRRNDATPGALQIHNRYLVAESEDGVLVIDQHALHERILYEHLRESLSRGPLERQALLLPEPVDLPPAEAAAVLENEELLAELGVGVAPFGGGTVLLSSYPAMLSTSGAAEVLRGLAAQLGTGGGKPSRRDVLDKILHSMACKAAVKAGDRLAPAEIDALLAARHLVHDSHHCPHGRPTALVFTRDELDRQFQRT